jgi:hypothetical protein
MAHSLVPPTISLPTSTPKQSAHLIPRADAQRQQLYSKRCLNCKQPNPISLFSMAGRVSKSGWQDLYPLIDYFLL